MKALLIPGALALLLAACGEYPQTIVYEQGKYHGKADARPYDGAPWNGDKAQWEKDIRARGQNQNEYKRSQ